MKLLTIIGARPQFIKAATVSRVIAARDDVTEILVHTGQHYDANMSDIFFEEMHIPKPDHHLGIGGGGHGQMTGRQLEAIERVLLRKNPIGFSSMAIPTPPSRALLRRSSCISPSPMSRRGCAASTAACPKRSTAC